MNTTPVLYCDPAASPGLHDMFMEYVRERILARHDILLRPGEICKNIYFVESGLLRCFYHHGGKEVTSWFAQKGDFCWSPESFLHQKPGIEQIEALEENTVISFFSFDALRCIYTLFPEFRALEESVTQRHLLAVQRKMQAMWMQQSPARLAWFQQEFPGLQKRIHGKHLASWLGITEVMMSRILHRT